jgi:hypothetical protein
MANLPINPAVSMSTLKSRILNPSLTSYYSVIINGFPDNPDNSKDSLKKLVESDLGLPYDSELMELTCMEASLPGSRVATIDINNDYLGVMQKNAYRRIYDDTIDLTFLVTKDSNYQQIRVFESWIKYITGGDVDNPMNDDYITRIRYPKYYKTTMQIAKFEKDTGYKETKTSQILVYEFKEVFPLSINSMPVTYDVPDILKVSVGLSYSRYSIKKEQYSNSLFDSNQNNQGQTPRSSTSNTAEEKAIIQSQSSVINRRGTLIPRGNFKANQP